MQLVAYLFMQMTCLKIYFKHTMYNWNKYLNICQSAVEDFLSFLHLSLWLLKAFVDDTKVHKDPDPSKLVVVVPETHPVKTCCKETAVTSETYSWINNGLWRQLVSCFWWAYLSPQSGNSIDQQPHSLMPWERPVVSWLSQIAGDHWPSLLPTVPVITYKY